VIGVVALLGGCGALQVSKKHNWASSVIERTKNLPESVCVSTMNEIEPTNPISWFWSPVVGFYFATDKSKELEKNIYLVYWESVAYDSTPVQHISIYDTASKKKSYVGTPTEQSTIDEEIIRKSIKRPKWENYTYWDKNIDDWLIGGRKTTEKYCLKYFPSKS